MHIPVMLNEVIESLEIKRNGIYVDLTLGRAGHSKEILNNIKDGKLIGFDKDQIIEIAQQIGTFETSILPYEDCCTIFLPKKPVTKPRLSAVEKIESVLDVETLVNNAMQTIETIVRTKGTLSILAIPCPLNSPLIQP